jgi:DNA modification methylase
VAKEQAHLYICCDIDGFHYARDWLGRVGWWVHRTPLVNFKRDGSRVPWPQHGPQRKWELILYANKGRKPVTHIYPDVIETKGDENFGHGAQKPVELYTNLLKRSVRPGDSVLDCFGGTGTVLPAAHELQCRATYVEQDEVAFGIAVKRLEGLK